jgi:circadian clock protein KaiC
MDTWISLRDIELGGERNRGLYVLKSRGMEHSNQIREFLLTDKGIDLIDVYVGGENVLTGSARAAQETKERAEETLRSEEIERKKRELDRKRQAMEAQVAALQSQYEAEEEELNVNLNELKLKKEVIQEDQKKMSLRREHEAGSKTNKSRSGRPVK